MERMRTTADEKCGEIEVGVDLTQLTLLELTQLSEVYVNNHDWIRVSALINDEIIRRDLGSKRDAEEKAAEDTTDIPNFSDRKDI